MKTIHAVAMMIVAAVIGFFLGSAVNGALEGAILFAMITGFACTISAIENIRED